MSDLIGVSETTIEGARYAVENMRMSRHLVRSTYGLTVVQLDAISPGGEKRQRTAAVQDNRVILPLSLSSSGDVMSLLAEVLRDFTPASGRRFKQTTLARRCEQLQENCDQWRKRATNAERNEKAAVKSRNESKHRAKMSVKRAAVASVAVSLNSQEVDDLKRRLLKATTRGDELERKITEARRTTAVANQLAATNDDLKKEVRGLRQQLAVNKTSPASGTPRESRTSVIGARAKIISEPCFRCNHLVCRPADAAEPFARGDS